MVISSPGDEIRCPDLSVELDIGVRTLQRTVIFYRTYRRAPRVKGLTWAHYRVLMQLQDADERAFYEDLAIDDSLSAKRLTVAIKGDRYADDAAGESDKPIELPRPTDPSYLYKAEPRDVVGTFESSWPSHVRSWSRRSRRTCTGGTSRTCSTRLAIGGLSERSWRGGI